MIIFLTNYFFCRDIHNASEVIIEAHASFVAKFTEVDNSGSTTISVCFGALFVALASVFFSNL